jgi:hypothetical protein
MVIGGLHMKISLAISDTIVSYQLNLLEIQLSFPALPARNL